MAHHLRTIVGVLIVALVISSPFACSAGYDDAPVGLDAIPAWDHSRLDGRGTTPAPYTALVAFEKLNFDTAAVNIEPWPNTNRLMVSELSGRVWTFDETDGVATRELLLELPDGPDTRGDQGLQLYSVELHPKFPQVPQIFVAWNLNKPKPAANIISRFTVTSVDPPRVDPKSRVDLLRWESNGHNGCDLHFGPTDGMLYATSGDGEDPGDPGNIGQTTDNLLGSIIRIDVDHPDPGKAYGVPADNPFVGVAGIRPEVWAYGLRNPWRSAFHTPTGDLIVGDNGDESWELVRVVRRGTNHGWSAFEGSHPYRSSNALGGPVPTLTPPIIEQPHSVARSAIGGPTYLGDKLAGLNGRQVYGDYVTGQVWAFAWDGKAVTRHERIATTGVPIVAFGSGHHGDLYIGQLTGKLLRLEPAAPTKSAGPFPERLSETGLFASTAEHRVAPGVIPFDINAPAWADGAVRRRYMALSKMGEAKPQLHRSLQFPDGSAFMQTLMLPTPGDAAKAGTPPKLRRIETQVIHVYDGVWRYYTYRWLDDQSDAVLVAEAGDNATFEVADTAATSGRRTQPWRFAGRSECATCHTQRTNFVLGLSPEQLHRNVDYTEIGGRVGGQLHTLEKLGVFAQPVSKWKSEPTPMTNPYDAKAGLEQRARAYLYVNCTHCHREGGVGGRAEFTTRYWRSLEEMRLVGVKPKVPMLTGADGMLVAPGDPDHSELFRRVSVRGAGQMPLLGSLRVDDEGIALLRRWIESLPR
ncbi:MAG: hypothetical protein GC159_07505 [Phycisphaera sp.]|nr:hypothetical protein [Phycisphaera sp.]